MSEFTPEWLTLREPFDTSARCAGIARACVGHFEGRKSITVCDLGAGTGASVRAIADFLPQHQQWTLVDRSSGILERARRDLSQWADRAKTVDDRLVLTRGSRQLDVKFRCRDFAADPKCWTEHTDLITASALLDLTAPTWIERLAAAIDASGAAVLATLSFDGRIHHRPVHHRDAEIARDFRIHQQRDKGFGVAAGPDAHRLLATALAARGFTVSEGDSDWMIAGVSPFRRAVVEGIVAAVTEIGALAPDAISSWRSALEPLVVGHRDLFATKS